MNTDESLLVRRFEWGAWDQIPATNLPAVVEEQVKKISHQAIAKAASQKVVLRNLKTTCRVYVTAEAYQMPSGFELGFDYFESSIPPGGYDPEIEVRVMASVQDVSDPE